MRIPLKSYGNFFNFFFLKYLLIPVFSFSTIYADSQQPGHRPSVGLVLSGGGARGIAHIGVLKVMEEAGLRPDYITGVSMGSIIGSLYSIGYRADTLHALLKNADWDLLLSNKVTENKVIFLQKKYFNNSIISLPVTLQKVRLPSSLINGQQIEKELGYHMWPAADINDFSKLPIPFECLAVDLLNYSIVELKSGYLPDAVRASFSVPTIFTPVKLDSLLLLDGGLIRNFAVSEIRNMGAEIVIGSYVGYNDDNKEEKLQTMSGIMSQIAMSRSLDDFRKEKSLADILVHPDMTGYPVYDFRNIDSIVMRGYKAALPYKSYFEKLADSLERIGPQKPVEKIFGKHSYHFDKIEAKGNKTYSDDQILGVLNLPEDNDISRDLLRERSDILFGTAWFDKVKYGVVHRNDSLILAIDCSERPPAMLYGSVHYDEALLAGVVLRMTANNLLTRRSVINIGTYIGQYYRLELNGTQFIGRNQKFGLSANLYSDNTLIPKIAINGEYGDVVSRNFMPGLIVSQRLGLNNLLSMSLEYRNMILLPKFVSDVQPESLSFNYLTGTCRYQVNTLKSKHFPDKGMVFNLSLATSRLVSCAVSTDSSRTILRGDDASGAHFDRFYTVSSGFRQYFPVSSKVTISAGSDLLYITGSDSLSEQNNFYLLGGIQSVNERSIPMTGFHTNEIPVKKLAAFNAGVDFEFLPDFHLGMAADIAFAQEKGRESGFSFLSGYGISLGYMSVIGPLKIGIMSGNYSRESFFHKTKGFISIGFNF